MEALVEERGRRAGPSAHWRPLSTAAAGDDEAALQSRDKMEGKREVAGSTTVTQENRFGLNFSFFKSLRREIYLLFLLYKN